MTAKLNSLQEYKVHFEFQEDILIHAIWAARIVAKRKRLNK